MRSRPPRSIPRAAGALAFLAACACAATASATITLGTEATHPSPRDSTKHPHWINYSDCADDVPLSFDVNLADYTNTLPSTIEVWIGTQDIDCRTLMSRTSGCAKVADFGTANATNGTIRVTIQSTAITTALGIEGCDDTEQSSGTPRQTKLYFMNMSGESVDPVADSDVGLWEETYVDLVGPPPPSGLQALVGEESLIVEFTKNDTSDLAGYYVYAEEVDTGDSGGGGGTSAKIGGPHDGVAGGSPGTGGAGSGSGGDGGMGGTGGSGSSGTSGSAGTGGAGAAGGSGSGDASSSTSTTTTTSTTTSSTSSGGSAVDPCSGSALREGERPPTNSSYRKGSTSKDATKIEASDLSNKTTYALAIAGYDEVDNPGVLSEVVCGTPGDLDDFFEIYRRAGGKAGGGLCGVSLGAPRPAGLFAATGLAALLGLALRRRAGRRATSPSKGEH
jgi:hypothetical protein